MFSRRAQLSLHRAALFGAALALAEQVGAATITGTVFEDRNYGGGAGRRPVRRVEARPARLLPPASPEMSRL